MQARAVDSRRFQGKGRWESFRFILRHRCSYCRRTPRLWQMLRQNYPGFRLKDGWYCSPECFEKATAALLRELRPAKPKRNEVRHRIPLGLLMMSRGQVSHEQIRRALRSQLETGQGKIGEWFETLGYSTEDQVIGALGVQWACPVFALDSKKIPSCSEMLPWRLLESFRMIPVHYVAPTGTMYIGFSGNVDYAVLHEIEQLLDCRTEPCLVRRSVLGLILKQISQRPRPFDIGFDGIGAEDEIAHVVSGYASQLRAEDVRIASCGNYFWLRLNGPRESMNLLFRKPNDSQTRTETSAHALDEGRIPVTYNAEEVTTSYPIPARRLSLPT